MFRTVAGLGLLGFALSSGEAMAAHTCPVGQVPIDHAVPTDPAQLVWEVEGRIQAYDRTARTMTANGMTLRLPDALLVETRNLDLTGNLSFATLTDPVLEADRTIVGGTVIALGTTVITATPTGPCAEYVADSVYVELAENVVFGMLGAVDVPTGTFRVNGALVQLNTDPRFPADLLDLGGAPITVDQLAGNEGTLVSVGGYFADDRMYGTLVETEIVPVVAGSDTVIIERAETQALRLRVRGVVTVDPATGAFVPSVNVHRGLRSADGASCPGALLGTAPIDPALGAFDFRRNFATVANLPANVCVASPAGGIDDSAVTRR